MEDEKKLASVFLVRFRVSCIASKTRIYSPGANDACHSRLGWEYGSAS
jgi:hypothetical protein